MADPKKIIPNQDSGFFENIGRHLKLVWRLMQDKRVNPVLKSIPVFSFVYFVFPLDIPGPFDDIAVVWGATTLFIEMCPLDVVEEHRAELDSVVSGKWAQDETLEVDEEDIIDAEYEEGSNRDN